MTTQVLDPDQSPAVDSTTCYHTLISLAQLTQDARQNWCSSSLNPGWVAVSHPAVNSPSAIEILEELKQLCVSQSLYCLQCNSEYTVTAFPLSLK